jgi:hypothetical protein
MKQNDKNGKQEKNLALLFSFMPVRRMLSLLAGKRKAKQIASARMMGTMLIRSKIGALCVR